MFYALVFLGGVPVRPGILSVAFDSGGVTTGTDDGAVHHGARRRRGVHPKRREREGGLASALSACAPSGRSRRCCCSARSTRRSRRRRTETVHRRASTNTVELGRDYLHAFRNTWGRSRVALLPIFVFFLDVSGRLAARCGGCRSCGSWWASSIHTSASCCSSRA